MPRPVQALAAALVLVPTLLWLVAVGVSRPPSPEDVEADLARVESTAEYADALASCPRSMGVLPCERFAYRVTSDLDRVPFDLSPEPWDVATVAVLATAGASLLLGALWRPGPGVRSFLRRTLLVATGTWLVAAEIGVFWWLGLSWVGRSWGLDTVIPDRTWSFVRHGALLVSLGAMAGAALGVLLRGHLRTLLSVSGAAVVAGAVLLLADPVDPWSPVLNVEAFLHGDASYLGPPEAEGCTEPDELLPLRIHPGFGAPFPRAFCTREVTRTTGAAATYLAGWTGLLLLVALTVTAASRRPPVRDA